jgi:hypothetical protein
LIVGGRWAGGVGSFSCRSTNKTSLPQPTVLARPRALEYCGTAFQSNWTQKPTHIIAFRFTVLVVLSSTSRAQRDHILDCTSSASASGFGAIKLNASGGDSSCSRDDSVPFAPHAAAASWVVDWVAMRRRQAKRGRAIALQLRHFRARNRVSTSYLFYTAVLSARSW